MNINDKSCRVIKLKSGDEIIAKVKGKENGNFRKILQVALELNVRVKEISPELIAQLRKEIKNINQQIKEIKANTMYQWGKSNDKLKLQIFELLTKNQKQL